MIRFSCDACGQRLQMPADRAGRQVKCARCQAVVTVPPTAEEIVDVVAATEAALDRPVPERRRPDAEDAEPAREETGRRALRLQGDFEDAGEPDLLRAPLPPSLLQAGMVAYVTAGWITVASAGLMAVALLLLGIAAMNAERGGSEHLARASLFLLVVGLVIYAVPQIPSLVAQALCQAAPSGAGAAALGAATLAFTVLSLALKTVFILVPVLGLAELLLMDPIGRPDPTFRVSYFWFIPIWLGISLEYVFFSLYLCLTGGALESRKVVSAGVRSFVMSLVMLVIGVACSIVLGVAFPGTPGRGVGGDAAADRVLIAVTVSAVGVGVLLFQGLILVHGASRVRRAAARPLSDYGLDSGLDRV